ncbi:MAG: DNA topoisomerase (ATP-hydrolyzing) subunit A [Spirochaetales bacterium]|nr:DNA topoisomerase (ATP-hydrolyzing) subunit A [Spirochaetales bacterium]
MTESKEKVIPVPIEDEIKDSYLNYAMSVIVSRALPDVRDGLKPVHRRILFAMNEMGLRSNTAYKKTGRIVGDVLGKYHPHGDLSIYDALVRMAQDFSLRYTMVDGQGNFGSIDGDPPAAMRYTEARLAKAAEEMLLDINKDTVDFGPNYDDSLEEPLVLPAALPFLLINGASGIAVGMATNMPPHNLREIAEAVVALIDTPDMSPAQLMEIVKGPDFPTGGIIYGRQAIKEAIETGRGRILVRARVVLEELKQGKEAIIITEIPYLVNKSALIIRIADLIKDKKIDGITDIRDESDRNGIRVVMELRRGAVPKIILNQLFANTQMQVAFSVNNIALVNGRPQINTLKDLLGFFIRHRREIVTRRSRFDLKKAEERAHILEGLKIALENIDEVIALIKQSQTVDIARAALVKRFTLSEIQAQAILDMRLQRLTGLEMRKIIDELKEVLALIAYLKDLLSSERKILNVVKNETIELSKKHGDDRRTEIVDDEVEKMEIEDLIPEEDMVVLISNRGLFKRLPLSAYRRQNRGGRGSSSSSLTSEDFITTIFIASTHDYVLFLTSAGKAYWIKVHEIPEGSKVSRGQSIKTFLAVGDSEDITAFTPITGFNETSYIFMATRAGIVKKVKTSEFANARQRGIAAINLDEGDRLIQATLSKGDGDIVLVTAKGLALRFSEKTVRPTGRSSHGVTGIKLGSEDAVIGAFPVVPDEEMVVISELGYGKRISYELFSPHGRATRGQLCYKVSSKTGRLTAALSVAKVDDLICITSQGNTIKLKLQSVPALGKTAVGVRIVEVMEDDRVVGIAREEKEEE